MLDPLPPTSYAAPVFWDAPLVDGVVTEPRVPPREFRIFVAGENNTREGVFLFDDEAATSVMERWAEWAVDLMMDWEHQSLAKPPIEAPASATRWVPQIRNGELWATEVAWTPRALERLTTGEYRYFSPAFNFEPKSRRITEVLNVALTNMPAMRGISALVAASARGIGNMDELKAEIEKLKKSLEEKDAKIAELEEKLATEKTDDKGEDGEAAASVMAALSLRAGAPVSEGVAHATALVTLRNNVRALTGAKNDAEAMGALNAWKDAQTKVAALSARLATIEAEQHEAAFTALVDEATKAGKLAPARKDEVTATLKAQTGGKVTADTVASARMFLSLLSPTVNTSASTQPPTVGALETPYKLHIDKVCGGPAKATAASAAAGR